MQVHSEAQERENYRGKAGEGAVPLARRALNSLDSNRTKQQANAVPAPPRVPGGGVRRQARPAMTTAAARSIASTMSTTRSMTSRVAASSKEQDYFDEIDEEIDEMDGVMVGHHAVAAPAPETHQQRLARLGVPDIDLEDANDPQAVTEYAVEIMDYMRSIEDSFMPNASYISQHPELNWHSRALLNNWIVELHWRYKLYPETLFLAVNLIDRYLSLVTSPVPRSRLQLVGTAGLIVAAKYEEIVVPSMEQFSLMTQRLFTEQDLIVMERQLLYVLQFHLNLPSPLTFLRRISKADAYDIPTRTVAKYFMEISVLGEGFLAYPPSMIAAASMLLARNILRKGTWDMTMQVYSGYTIQELEPCVRTMIAFISANHPDFRSVYKKFSSSKFLRASLFAEQEIRRFMGNAVLS